MKNRITHNFGLKILSIMFATLLWFLVVSVDDPITTRTFTQIPVELVNSEVIAKAGQVYEIDGGSDSVNITVTAKRSVLDGLGRDNFKATADMTKLENNLVPIEVRAMRYADRLEDITLKNKNVRVVIEALMEKQFNINVATTGSLAEGHVVGSVTPDKNIVKISGPESIVSSVESAIAYVDVSGMSSDIYTSEDIVLLNKNDEEVSQSELTLSRSSVNIQVGVYDIKEVPVLVGHIGTPAEGYGASGVDACTPSNVTIAGRAAALDAVNSISIPASAVDITGASRDVEMTVGLNAYLPDGIVVTGDDASVTVHVGVIPLQSKYIEVPTANITAIGIPDGMKATVGGLGEVMAVQVRGLGEAYDNVNPATVVGTVDLSSIEPDEETGEVTPDVYEIPVVFAFPEGVSGGNNSIKAKVLLQYIDDATSESDSQETEETSDSQHDSAKSDESTTSSTSNMTDTSKNKATDLSHEKITKQ